MQHYLRRRPLLLKLTLLITVIIVLAAVIITTATVRRERQTFRKELEQQATLLLNTLAASGADALYFLEADFLSDLMADLGRFDVITYGRYYDAEGRIIADAIEPNSRFAIEPDPFGQQLIGSHETIFRWETDQLIAGQAVKVGNQTIGAVSVGLPLAMLTEKITAVRQQSIAVASSVALVGVVVALAVSRSITEPLQQMITATAQVAEGDLSQRVHIRSGDELQVLGDVFNKMTAELQQTHQQMEQEIEERKKAQTALQAAKESAEMANRAKSAFLANMSHELRTPLNAILGFAQLMARRNLVGPKDRQNLDIIIQSGHHLLTLINQVLDMSKIEAGRMTLQETPFNLYQMIEDLEGMFRLRAKEKQVKFIVDTDFDMPPMIRGDEVKLRQVLINLLNNALKFTQKGHVALRVRYETTTTAVRPLHFLHFSVEDSGPGIEAEEMDKVFEAFVRAKAGIQSGEGTGLGLSLSRQFARLMGGDMTVHNVGGAPGNGAIFKFTIQIVPMADPVKAAAAPSKRIVGLAPHQPTIRLLVVDDNRDIRLMLLDILRPLGFAVDEASDGQEAVEKWATWRPHLILMDLRMPEMDGYEATQLIREQASESEPVIIAITASMFSRDQETILAAGCQDFIYKPLQTEQILDVIKKYLGVEYVYESVSGAGAVPTAVEPHLLGLDSLSQAFTQLPKPLRMQLRQATAQADMGQIDTLITQIQGYNSTLANELKRLADDFEYGKIVAWLQNIEEDTLEA